MMASIFALLSSGLFTGQLTQHAQEHLAVTGGEFSQPTLLAALDLGLRGILDSPAGIGDGQQPHPAVLGIGPTFDIPLLLQLVEGRDDVRLVRADGLGQRGLGSHRRPVQRELGTPFEPAPDVVAAVLPLAMTIPDGDLRDTPDAPFGPAITAWGTTDFEKILAHLGWRPDWAQP
jgi:hypothetical protein